MMRLPDHLFVAIEEEDYDIAQELIDKGTDVNAITLNGKTPLLWISEDDYEGENLDMMEFLIENGADVNAKTKDGLTPLHYAVGNACKGEYLLDLVEFLVKKGADVNARNNQGETPLSKATIPEIKYFLEIESQKTSSYN
ncbi:hypothetical protein AGMMS49938_18810 [Fibrobacterales bacterium]|nr:hypothetical protein AGMMS49938_18810 [Fibrobacterales bacterium]